MSVLRASLNDMALKKLLPMTQCPDEIPLIYKIGGVVYRGIPSSFCPVVKRTAIDCNITQFTFSGVSPEGVTVCVEGYEYRDFPVTEWVAYFSNATGAKSPIVEDIRIFAELVGTHPVLYHSNGDTCDESGYETYNDAIDGPITVKSSYGLPNANAFPYMRVCTDGVFYNVALGWTGGWFAEYKPISGGVRAEIGQARCHMTILPGETMRSPRVTFMAAGESEDNARNLWRKWYFAHILPRENGKPIPPKMCMHVIAIDGEEFTGATTAVQCLGMQTFIDKGVKPDVWWMDAGWYPCDHKWYTGVGTWHCDYQRFPNGLGDIGDKCRANGIQYLLWFEPERVRPNTEIYDSHPEWLLSAKGSDNYLLNLANPDALKWLIEYINARIDEYHVDIYRQDFNFEPLPYWEQNEAPDRIGAIENLHVQGYLAYWDSLIDRHEGLWIDSCAGGGRRNDLDTMRRAVTLHYTDIGYGNHPIKQKQHRLMFEWIPYFRAHNKSWDNKDGTYGTQNCGGDRYSYHNAMTPALTNSLCYLDSEKYYQYARDMVPIWRRAAEIELRADYYPLTVCRKDPHDWFAMQFDDPDERDGFVQVIRNTLVSEDVYLLKMKAVKPDAVYVFTNAETGETLRLLSAELNKGIEIRLERRTAVLLFYNY